MGAGSLVIHIRSGDISTHEAKAITERHLARWELQILGTIYFGITGSTGRVISRVERVTCSFGAFSHNIGRVFCVRKI